VVFRKLLMHAIKETPLYQADTASADDNA